VREKWRETMGAIVVLVPVISAAWPTVSATVLGAAATLGFAQTAQAPRAAKREECVSIDVEGSRAVTEGLSNDERMTFVKDNITVTFERDARGKCGIQVSGSGQSRSHLEQVGREFAQQVVQQYAYHRLMEELSKQNFSVVSQEVGQDKTIHIQVRRFAS
jgi:hypothetical protein